MSGVQFGDLCDELLVWVAGKERSEPPLNSVMGETR